MSQPLALPCQSRRAKLGKMPQFSGCNLYWAVSPIVADHCVRCAKANAWNLHSGMNMPSKGQDSTLLVDHWGSWRRVGVTTWKLLPFSDSICPWFPTPCNLCGMLNAESVHVLQADDPCSSESETQKEVLIWLFFYSLQCRENFDSMSCCCKRWLFIKHMKKAWVFDAFALENLFFVWST